LKPKTGLQIYTLREMAAEDLFGTIEGIAKAGYDGIEFDAGMLDRADPKKLKAVMDENHLSVIGITILLHEIDDKLSSYIAYAQMTGAEWIVMPWIDESMRQSADDYICIAQKLNQTAAKVRAAGLRFFYHIHGFEFKDIDGQTGFDVLKARLDFSLVEIQLDTFWIEEAGFDCVQFAADHIQQIGSFHMKDAKSRYPMTDTEVGEGLFDMVGIIKLGLANRIAWFIVEQEAFEMPELESVAISQKNLRSYFSAAA
jgi:sugar phosphate isomerase/epimerase